MAVKVSVSVCLIPEAKGGPFVLWDDLPGSIRLAADLGFDAIELFPPEPDALDPAMVKELLAQHGLAVSAVGSGAGWVRHKLSLTHVDASHRARASEFAKNVIDFAATLDAPVIVGSMQGRWGDGVSKESALGYLGDALTDLGNHAASRGQVLLYEPLNRYETNLLNTIEDGLRFVRGLSTRGVKLMADLYHMNIEEADIGGAIRAGGKYIGHVHFADSNRRPAGFGHTDFGAVVAAVREIGYDGYFAAEALPYPNPEEAARQTVNKFRELFREPDRGRWGAPIGLPLGFQPGKATPGRLYPLVSSPHCGGNRGFYTGHFDGGLQVFVARTGSERIAIARFEPDGSLVDLTHYALPSFDSAPENEFWDVNEAKFHQYLADRFRISPGAIRVQPFEIQEEGISIDDLPHLFRLVLEDPNRFGWNDEYRDAFLKRIEKWKADKCFNLNWQANETRWFPIDGQGNVIVEDDF